MKMDETQALDAFGALSQPTRLQMVRALVIAGAEGMAAGDMADLAGTSSSGASFHLAHLERAGLVTSRRVARSIIYVADYETLSSLVAFLLRDCCHGHPKICGPASQVAMSCCTSVDRMADVS
jgi:DNA-binding transcriptional ArsR family regulator